MLTKTLMTQIDDSKLDFFSGILMILLEILIIEMILKGHLVNEKIIP